MVVNLLTSIVEGRHSQTLHDCFVVVFLSSVAADPDAGTFRPACWKGIEPSFNEYLVMFIFFPFDGAGLCGQAPLIFFRNYTALGSFRVGFPRHGGLLMLEIDDYWRISAAIIISLK